MINVLVIDDDFMVARIHSSFVDRTDGFRTVAAAHDAAGGVAKAVEHRPDLVLLDIYLPDRSGLEVLPDLRTAAPEADIMIISAATDADTVRSTVRQGVVDYLLKPFSQELLSDRLQAYAQRRQQLAHVTVWSQEELDRALRGRAERNAARLPKGLSPETALLIEKALAAATTLSATEAGEAVGISRVSARRYLEWLAGDKRVEVQLRYGSQGRPERLYRLRTERPS